MNFDKILKYGNCFIDGEFIKTNIAIKNGKIAEIFDHDNFTSKEVINASNKYIIPGCIDAHFHVRSPSYPSRGTIESETMAAAAGGVTTVFEMPISNPCCSTPEIFNSRKEYFKGRSYVNYGLFAAPGTIYQQNNKSYKNIYEKDFDKISSFKEIGAIGFKIFMIKAPRGRENEFNGLSIVDEGHLYHTLKLIKNTNLVTTVHAENDSLLNYYNYSIPLSKKYKPETHNELRPTILESAAINTLLFLNKSIDTKLHIAHLSSEEGLEIIQQYQNTGSDVSTETCPHYLLFNKTVLSEYGNFAKINPPIRGEKDRIALWEGINNSNITIIASDHAGFCYDEKIKEKNISKVPPGHPGVNSLLYSLLNQIDSSKKITLKNIVNLCSTNPAKRFDIYPQKGCLKQNSDADLIVLDLNEKGIYDKNMQFSLSKDSDYLYNGMEINGSINFTIVNGVTVYKNNNIIKLNKPGKFVKPLI